MSSGSGPPRMPVSSASIAVISLGVSAKSKTSKFSAIRCGLTDFGIAEIAAERRPGLGGDAVRNVEVAEGVVGEERVQLDLVDGRHVWRPEEAIIQARRRAPM